MSLYCAICTEGLLQENDLEDICVGKCGHTFHYSCINLNANGKVACPVKPCQEIIMADTVLQVFPILWPYRTSLASGSVADHNDLQNDDRQMMCSICNDPMTDLKKISVAQCGHTFHYNCLIRWIRFKSKQCKCAVISCNKYLTKSRIIQIHPTMAKKKQLKRPLVDKVKKDQPIHREVVKSNEPMWETVIKLIQEKFKDPNMAISEYEAIDLKKKIAKLKPAERWQMLSYDDKPMKFCLQATNDKPLLAQCKKCEKKEAKITSLRDRMTNAKNQKARYQRENEYLKEQKKMAMAEGILSISYLREANAQKIIEIEELRKNNEALQHKIQTLESEAVTTGTDLSEANGQISELKQSYEEMQQEYKQEIQTLQSKEITAREENFRHVAELQELRSRNDDLTEQNDLMNRDLIQLREDFTNQDSYIKNFMIKELQMKLHNETFIDNLYLQINNLQESNNNLRMHNEDLVKENDYRWELLMNIRSCVDTSEADNTDM